MPKYGPAWILLAGLLVSACSFAEPAVFPVFDAHDRALPVSALDKVSVAGELRLDHEGVLKFSLEQAAGIESGSALELEYELVPVEVPQGVRMVFSSDGEPSWLIPPDASFLGLSETGRRVYRYRFPLEGNRLSGFSLSVGVGDGADRRKTGEPADKGMAGAAGAGREKSPPPLFRLRALRVRERAYGFAINEDHVLMSPYVYKAGNGTANEYVIDVAEKHRPQSPVGISMNPLATSFRLRAGSAEFVADALPEGMEPFQPDFTSGVLPLDPYPISLTYSSPVTSFLVAEAQPLPFPEPIPAEPGIILSYRKEAWRNGAYELFRWSRFPSILIFDTSDYAAQDRLFKRLAFFVEKAGFRGRIASDAEIAQLHAWNAHDYSAESLARFFEMARKTATRLNADEKELLGILVANGLVRRSSDSTILPGEGAIISISRESDELLRNLFMVHECYHGLFFIDEDFRSFATGIYRNLPPEPLAFLHAYFDSMRYDVKDEYLMTNELMAYLLQQPVSLVTRYFGETLPSRLEKDARRNQMLKERKDGELGWPELAEAFRQGALVYDGYVRKRWGLRAGKVSPVYQISRTRAAR